MGKYLSFLQECEIFSGIPVTELKYIEEFSHECSYKNNSEIIKENSSGRELFLVIKGKVKIIVTSISTTPIKNNLNDNVAISTLSRGQSFGEMSIIDGGARSAKAIAIEDNTLLLRIEKEPLLELCKQNPNFGYRFMNNIANDLANKIRVTDMVLREVISGKNTDKTNALC